MRTHMDKKIIRKQAIEKSKSIKDKQVKETSIVKTLLSICSKYNRIGVYLAKDNEVNINSLINLLFMSKKRVFAPKITQNEIKFIEISDLSTDSFTINNYGIREPLSNKHIEYDDLDLIIVPGVAFDRLMDRLGHGKGYYDKYLLNFKGVKVGVCFEETLFEELPTDSHDIKVDMVVTDKQTIKNRN